VINKLNAELNVVLKDKDLLQRWEALGISALGGTAADALRRNEVETAKWGAVIDAAKIKLD
jgi:hypothetical protein